MNETENLDWESLHLFVAVARAGGLRGAANQTGISAPTLGRRMDQLEKQLRTTLFARRRTGYVLNAAGEALYAQVREMESAAAAIERWRDEDTPRRLVRISAGAWTCRFLAQHIDRLWSPSDSIVLELVTAHQRLDIVRREADIGLRNRAPEDSRLATRRLPDMTFAAYCAANVPPDDQPWISAIGDAGITPSARWVAQTHDDAVMLASTDPNVILHLLRAGAGQAVLPCFVGDGERELKRAGEPIADLYGQQWLVLNERARHGAATRLIIDRLVALFLDFRPLFEGRAPVAG
jgi:DNA-binding transcriptional LysR family regulator